MNINKNLTKLALLIAAGLCATQARATPVLQSFTFTPTTIDVSTADQTLTFTAHVTDSGSGFRYGGFQFEVYPTLVPFSDVQFTASQRTSGTASDGIYQGSFTIPKNTKAGQWPASIVVSDNSGNGTSYGGQGSANPAPPGTPNLTVVNNTAYPTPNPTPNITGAKWPKGKKIEMVVNLPTKINYTIYNPQDYRNDRVVTAPSDGEASFDAAAMKAAAQWNHWMKDVSVTVLPPKPGDAAPTFGNGKSEIYFDKTFGGPDYSVSYNQADSNAQGTSYYDQLLKVYTKLDANGNIAEVDVAINGNVMWDLYDGGSCPKGSTDPFRPYGQTKTLAIYELKRLLLHAMGHILGLPDINQDLGGGRLYIQAMNSVYTMNQPYGNPMEGNDDDVITPGDQRAIQGLYGDPFPPNANGFVIPTPISRLVNISTRMGVGKDENVLITGFIIENQNNKKLKLGIRGMGPSLGAAGVTGSLQDPTLELYDGAGTKIATNDNWQTTQTGSVVTQNQAGDIQQVGLAPNDPREAVIIAALGPGSYTAVERGAGNTTGVGLVEVYQLDNGGLSSDLTIDDGAKLLNLSTRGQVLTGNNVMIGGMIIQGNTSKKIAIRAMGPSLTAAGIQGALANPSLELHNGSGDLVASNDDWQNGQQIDDITKSGVAPGNNQEATLIAMLAPGSYTAIVQGVNNSTGVGLIEFYDLDPEAQLSK